MRQAGVILRLQACMHWIITVERLAEDHHRALSAGKWPDAYRWHRY